MSDHIHGEDCSHENDMADEEKVRRAAHIILDGVSVGLEEGGPDPVELAFSHLLEIDAIELTLDEEEDELELDISPLMGGVLLVVRRLVAELAQRDGIDPEAVVMTTRAAIDEAHA